MINIFLIANVIVNNKIELLHKNYQFYIIWI
jgi:hypothetical protein